MAKLTLKSSLEYHYFAVFVSGIPSLSCAYLGTQLPLLHIGRRLLPTLSENRKIYQLADQH